MKKWASLWLVACLALCAPAFAQESVCARVKIEIKQELTLERQAFDAEMKLTNSLPATPLTDIQVDVKVTDELGAAVPTTSDPNDVSAKFFIRQTQKQGIENTTGTGQVGAGSTATVNWLLIPAPGSAGTSPFGKRYLVGATLRYRFNGEVQVMELNPDMITVKPLPQLTLDYFLTRDVVADDPFTPQIEAPVPYTLGVRVKNAGLAAAKQLKIESAQPKIIENRQGLPITFKIIGSYVQDAPANNSLLIDFGTIPASTSKMGRWVMESNLAGTFVDFTARFTHSDELGGALTSLLQDVKTHSLMHDVRVDLPGRDMVRDFLALDGSAINIYESNGEDNAVADRSNEATLVGANGNYSLTLAPSLGFLYIKKPDPYQGRQAIGRVMRGDAKLLAPENVWLSRSKNETTGELEYWVNVFDVNSTGTYAMSFQDPPPEQQAPVLQFIPDRVIQETRQLGFLVEASSPMGRKVSITATQLPKGATLQDQGDGLAIFDWTPAVGQTGEYIVNYFATDGTLTSTRSAKIRVDTKAPPAGPAIPQLLAPLSGAQVPSLRPLLSVLTGQASNEPTRQVEFELYADVGKTQRLARTVLNRNTVAGEPTSWTLTEDLNDNTHYWWRARAIGIVDTTQGSTSLTSEWVDGTFFVNLFNNPPENFNLTTPVAGADVDSLQPILSVTNAVDRDEDTVTYGFELYSDSALTQRYAGVSGLVAGGDGMTHWTVDLPLVDHATYYWRAIATDDHGAQTATPARMLRVYTGNRGPTEPTIQSPVRGSDVTTPGQALLRVNNAVDPENDAVSYRFEIDRVNTFDSSERRASSLVPAGSGTTEWTFTGLTENVHYYWRAKATDGHTESEWVVGDFILDAVNEAPPTPTIGNPGDRAWVGSVTPTFEANAVIDPEADAVTYRFEVYRDAAMTSLATSGISSTPLWTVTTPLQDKTTHYWRISAQDSNGAVSAWTAPVKFYVSTGTYVAPSISVLTPSTIVDARSRSAVLNWAGTDPNIEPTIALYYDTTGTGFGGTKIVDGLHQNAGTQTGAYTWDMSSLPAGAYSVYGTIYDDRGIGRGYAPGTLVVPTSPQRGSIKVVAAKGIKINETNGSATFTVALGRAPTKDVIVPISSSDTTEATVQPQQLTFTAANWSTPQTVTIRAVDDGIKDGNQPFTITVGNAVSKDPDYIGLSGTSVAGQTVDNKIVRAGGALTIASYELVSKRYVKTTKLWRYEYRAVLSNSGAPLTSVVADITEAGGYQIASGRLRFGAIGTGESATSTNTIVLNNANDTGLAPPVLVWIYTAN